MIPWSHHKGHMGLCVYSSGKQWLGPLKFEDGWIKLRGNKRKKSVFTGLGPQSICLQDSSAEVRGGEPRGFYVQVVDALLSSRWWHRRGLWLCSWGRGGGGARRYSSHFILKAKYRKKGTSLVVQWWRICLAMQGTRVPSLVGDLRSHTLCSH